MTKVTEKEFIEYLDFLLSNRFNDRYSMRELQIEVSRKLNDLKFRDTNEGNSD